MEERPTCELSDARALDNLLNDEAVTSPFSCMRVDVSPGTTPTNVSCSIACISCVHVVCVGVGVFGGGRCHAASLFCACVYEDGFSPPYSRPRELRGG